MSITGTISDIKHYAINDGPGIRVTVFLKGCPLACAWCHNPESIAPQRELMHIASRCIRCGECIGACPAHALRAAETQILRDRSACTHCGACTEACPALALEMVGAEISVDDVLAALERDRPFFEHSGGGATFSGGEPLMQPAFLTELLRGCRDRGTHTAVDTCGHCPPRDLASAAEFTDLFLFDLKLADSQRHRQWTGAGTDRIHANLKQLCDRGAAIIFRMPLIDGINCDRENIEQTAALIASMPGDNRRIDLLPWHSIAIRKYAQLDREYPHAGRFAAPTPQAIREAVVIFAQHGIEARAH